jgi:hypothetical protein
MHDHLTNIKIETVSIHTVLHNTHEQTWMHHASILCYSVSGTIIRGTLKAPNSQLVTPISIKLQRPDGDD